MSLENSESHIADLSELRHTRPGIEISGSPETGAWEAVRRDGAKTHILVAMTLPSLAAKNDVRGLASQIMAGQGASPFLKKTRTPHVLVRPGRRIIPPWR
jgi:hypothetical protein